MVVSIAPMFDLRVAESARCCRGNNAVITSLDTPSLDTTVLFSGVPVETGNTRPDLYSGRNIWRPVASAGDHPDGSRAQDGKVSLVAITAI